MIRRFKDGRITLSEEEASRLKTALLRDGLSPDDFTLGDMARALTDIVDDEHFVTKTEWRLLIGSAELLSDDGQVGDD